jgi:hypothetical protein
MLRNEELEQTMSNDRLKNERLELKLLNYWFKMRGWK